MKGYRYWDSVMQGMLGHTDIETTRTYYAPILQERMRLASAKMDGLLTTAKPKTATSSRKR